MVPERDAMKTLGAAAAFFASRDVILKHRTDYASAVREFTWPAHEHFNWALDYFDTIAAGNHRPALHILEEDGTQTIRSFAELSASSNRVANFLRGLGARRGDCLLLMLGNEVSSSTPNDFQPSPHIGLEVLPLMNR